MAILAAAGWALALAGAWALARAAAAERSRGADAIRMRHALLELSRQRPEEHAVRIRAVAEQAARTLRVARASVWQASPRALTCLDLYELGPDRHSAGARLEAKDFPGYFAALENALTVPAANAATDPATREFAAAYLGPLGIGAMLDVPIRRGGTLVGVLCLEHVGGPRPWTNEEQTFAAALAGLAAIALEAAARAAAEAQAAAGLERLDAALHGADLALWDWDVARGVVAYNDRHAELFGTTRGKLGNEAVAWRRFLHPDDLPEFERRRAEGLEKTGAFNSEFRIRRDDTGEWRWVLSRAQVRARDAAGKALRVVGTNLDITDRRRAEELLREANGTLEARVAARTAELAAANDRLAELDRLKSEFLATMSHELRTPLNSILGFSGILLMGLPGPLNDEQRKQLGMVQGSAKHLLSLINDLLDLSRIESGRCELDRMRFDLRDALAEACRTLQPLAAAKGLALRLADGPPLPLVGDRKRALQVALNLVNNAVKFTLAGRVDVEARAEPGRVEVAVRDTGIGIRPEQMPNLFQAFRQLDSSARRNYEGSGLGLHLCKQLLRLMGGGVAVESVPGRGSTFRFWLPEDAPA